MEPLPPASSPATSATEPGDTIDLRGYLRAALRAKRWIGLTAIVATLVGGGLALLSPRVYEAKVIMEVSVSRPDNDRLLQTAPAASVKPVLQGRAMAQALIKEFGLDKPPASLTPSSFLSSALTVEEIRTTNLLEVKVRLPDPGQAAAVATSLATRASAAVKQLSDDDATRAKNLIRQQLAEARKRYEDAATALKGYRDTAQIEALRKDVAAVVGQRGDLLGLLVRIESEMATLKTKDVAERLFIEISAGYEQALLQVTARRTQLEIVDPAVPPDQPLSRNVVIKALIGFFLGFVLSTAAAFLVHAVRSAALQ